MPPTNRARRNRRSSVRLRFRCRCRYRAPTATCRVSCRSRYRPVTDCDAIPASRSGRGTCPPRASRFGSARRRGRRGVCVSVPLPFPNQEAGRDRFVCRGSCLETRPFCSAFLRLPFLDVHPETHAHLVQTMLPGGLLGASQVGSPRAPAPAPAKARGTNPRVCFPVAPRFRRPRRRGA